MQPRRSVIDLISLQFIIDRQFVGPTTPTQKTKSLRFGVGIKLHERMALDARWFGLIPFCPTVAMNLRWRRIIRFFPAIHAVPHTTLTLLLKQSQSVVSRIREVQSSKNGFDVTVMTASATRAHYGAGR